MKLNNISKGVNMQENKYIIINNLKPYFYTLININNQLIRLTCFKGYDNFQKSDIFLEICDLILKFIPTKKLKNNKVLIDEESGILLINEIKKIILPEFQKIEQNHYKIISNLKKLRNKVEHEPHNIVRNFILSGECTFRGFCYITFQYKDSKISVSTDDLMVIINYLNQVFSKIQKYIISQYSKEEILKQDYYYHELINENFNEIITK